MTDTDFQKGDEAEKKEREAQDFHYLKVCSLTPLLTSVLSQTVFPTAGLLTCAPTSFPSLPGPHAALFLLQALTNFLKTREGVRCRVDDFMAAYEDLPENKERCAHTIHRLANPSSDFSFV